MQNKIFSQNEVQGILNIQPEAKRMYRCTAELSLRSAFYACNSYQFKEGKWYDLTTLSTGDYAFQLSNLDGGVFIPADTFSKHFEYDPTYSLGCEHNQNCNNTLDAIKALRKIADRTIQTYAVRFMLANKDCTAFVVFNAGMICYSVDDDVTSLPSNPENIVRSIEGSAHLVYLSSYINNVLPKDFPLTQFRIIRLPNGEIQFQFKEE